MGDDLREILFPQSDPRHDTLSVSESGHISYMAFRNDLYRAPKNEQEALAAWEKYKQATNERWAKRHKDQAPIFPDYLRMLPNVEAHYMQDLNGNQALDYWILNFQIELRVLRLKSGTTLLSAASVLKDYQSPFTQDSSLSEGEVLRKQAEKISHAVLEGDSLRVQIGEHGWVVGMEYHHTLLHPTPHPSELYTLAPPKTGAQSVQKTATLANFVVEARNNLVVPMYAGTREAACREGVGFTPKSKLVKYINRGIIITGVTKILLKKLVGRIASLIDSELFDFGAVQNQEKFIANPSIIWKWIGERSKEIIIFYYFDDKSNIGYIFLPNPSDFINVALYHPMPFSIPDEKAIETYYIPSTSYIKENFKKLLFYENFKTDLGNGKYKESKMLDYDMYRGDLVLSPQ